MKVIFDSSFLMAVAERPTTWFEDIAEKTGKPEPIVLECVLTELRRLASGQGRKAKTARVALEIAGGFFCAPSGEAGPDQEIASAALSMKAAVATTDTDLSSSLLALNIQVFSLRSGRATLVRNRIK